jgi:alkanesulfonate monooxygenase SsuD/methylene tetrahydromethanopterin reductase-like flavin-dependent oxidoreductase (luciferase family)
VKIGIGLPNPVNGYQQHPGTRLVEWARRAEERGFSGLATIDRVVYPSYDSLTALAAAAGATSRIGLMTNILLGPVYPTALLAKTAASLDQVSGGRFTLGIAPGGRADDYAAAGADFGTRGRDFDGQLDVLHKLWQGEPLAEGGPAVTPAPVNGGRVPVMIGGGGKAAIRRAVTWADGFTIGGAPPERVGPVFDGVRAAWKEAGRDGEPRLAALAYFSLGGDAEADSRGYLKHYYAFLGDFAGMIADGALRTPEAIRGAVKAYADAGATELYLDPTTSDLDQLDRLADVVA